MKILAFLSIFLFVCASFAQEKKCEINVVPQPKSVQCPDGSFKLNHKTKIVATDNAGKNSAGILNDLLMKNYGFKLEYTSGKTPDKNFISFTKNNSPAAGESYKLNIAPKSIEISGNDAGQFYALQTLMQILPAEFKGEAKMPAVNIADAPRFGYRGMHLDTSRHFMPVEFVKKYIDLMSQYKFNQFHWHLTDDQGWRIEIKKYPRLTEIGSKRAQSQKGKYSLDFNGDGVPVEGFYTQEQIKDVVAFAKARHVNIIPEIEMPGHASASLTAYPNLGCKENYNYKVQMTWGIFPEVYCPKEETFQFLEDVLTETIALFPDSPYIHIGGDEVKKDFWKDSSFVQELKQKENLKDEHEVQSYFIRRMEKFINSKGRKIIGWDEILEGGVAPNATIMSWRGEKGGIEAAKAKHDVIMTPNTYLYLDYNQGDPKYEPLNIGNFVPLEKVYSYDPISPELSADEAKYVLGAQANIWTEYLPNPAAVEYMAFPRMLALAEVNWSPKESKNFADFLRRMPRQYRALDRENVNYRIPEPEGLRNIMVGDSGKAKIELNPRIANGKIFYTLNGSAPTAESKRYDKPFEINLKQGETVEMKIIVVNEKSRASSIYTAVITRRAMLKPVQLTESTEGLNVEFFKGNFKSVKDFETVAPTETGTTKSISLGQFAGKTNKLADAFGVKFTGFLNVPQDEVYEFEIDAKDGTVLKIDDEVIIEADGQHARQTKIALVPLAKGYHKFSLQNFQSGGKDSYLNLRWTVKGSAMPRYSGSGFVR